MPNNLDVATWESLEKKKFNDGKVRIGFIASSSHSEGVWHIKKPVLAILEKYPNVEFYITHVYHNFFDDAKLELKERIKPIPWIALKDWPKGVKDLGFDIGLAPLADNNFNRCKSNLRWMEYSLADMTTIASPVKPYLCIKDGVDGLLVREQSEWYNAMEKLILDDKKLRLW